MGLLGSFHARLGADLDFSHRYGPASAWRWNLYISGSLMLTGAALVFLLYKPLPRSADQTDTFADRMLRFDWIGALLFAGFVLPFMMALIWVRPSATSITFTLI